MNMSGWNVKKLLLALAGGGLGLWGAVWAQGYFWPHSARREALSGVLTSGNKAPTPPPGGNLSNIDWEHPPLPPQSTIIFPLCEKTSMGLRVQYMCESGAGAGEIRDFYKSQLARDGWTIYNGARLSKAGTENLLMYRDAAGRRLQFWLTVFPPRPERKGKTGFRIAVLPRPLNFTQGE